MSSSRITSRARRDLVEIWRRIAEDSEANADRFVRRLIRQIEVLGENPYVGRRRDDLKMGYRSFPFRRYLIFYRVEEPGIVVAHVLHGSRDLEKALGRR